MTGVVRAVDAPKAVLGEGPVWDPETGMLHWVDADQKKLFRYAPATGQSGETDLPIYPGCYAFRNGGGLIMAYRTQLALFDTDPADAQVIETPGVEFAAERFNDGACDRAGRFWIGTMDKRLSEPVGHLFRLDPDRKLTSVVSDLTASNGIAFSPDDRFMYHTDTGAQRIYRYDYDLGSGALSGRTVFADFTDRKGRPDGCTIDAEGHLWVAEINAGQVVRIAPDGGFVEAVELPVTRPTSAMFGGPDLTTLYITSMQFGLKPEELEKQPLAGGLLAVQTDVPGLPEPRFGG